MLADDDCALFDDIERIGVVHLAKNYRAGSEFLGDQQGRQSGQGMGFEVLEQDDFSQNIGKGWHKRMSFCATMLAGSMTKRK